MMEWTQLADEHGYRCLSIEAAWDEIAADYRDLVTRCAATARLPGFRPGKTPRDVVERRFQEEIMEELSVRTVQRLGREALQDTDIKVLGSLEAFEVECAKEKPFRARVRYFPVPEFLLPGPADLEMPDDGIDPRDQISRRLLELAQFELPAELVRQELDRDGLGDSAPGSEVWQAAADRIRLMVILKQIARREGIEIDEKDVDSRIAEKAREFGTTVKGLRTELEEGAGMDRLQDLLLAESTLEYLIVKARQ
jgi:FKBP-type peptidyl-prolyl cis-trans isomerase (trigger factor)